MFYSFPIFSLTVPFKLEPKFNPRRRTSSVTTTTFSSPRLQPPPSLNQTGNLPQNCRIDALSPRLPPPPHTVSFYCRICFQRCFFHKKNFCSKDLIFFACEIFSTLSTFEIFCFSNFLNYVCYYSQLKKHHLTSV